MIRRYTQLAVDVERARLLASPGYMHASLQFSSGGVAVAGRRGGHTAESDALLAADRDLFREAAAYGPLVMQLLRGVLAFDDAQFAENLHWLYPLLTGLIVCGNLEVRQLLAGVFDQRLRPLLAIRGVPGSEADPTMARAQAAVAASAAAIEADVLGSAAAGDAE
jgi:hypothetical protein